MHMVEHNDDNSDNEVDAYTTEFFWSSKAKPYMCNALKPIHKNRDEEMSLLLIYQSVIKYLMLSCKIR